MISNYKKSPTISPVDWFNYYGEFRQIFEGKRNFYWIDGKENEISNDDICQRKPSFIMEGTLIKVVGQNDFDIATGTTMTKFMLYSIIQHAGFYEPAINFVKYNMMGFDIPFIRVGSDYINKFNKFTRGVKTQHLKKFSKEEIKQDFGKEALIRTPKYDDFIIYPNNKDHRESIGNCYNIYSRFQHKPSPDPVTLKDIPNSAYVMKHIFGEQVFLGYKYLKVLYERPTQSLPIFTMVSEERGTGKSTFINWLSYIFGDNTVQIEPQMLVNSFNESYATKNIIMIDESVVEKSTAVERLKTISTAKIINVNAKFVNAYSIDFYGKVIMATNKERDFMRVDSEEIRFWVRKIKPIPKSDFKANIEEGLKAEIPKLIRYLDDMPPIDYENLPSRMVFTAEELQTKQLEDVKAHSKSALRKEIEIYFEDFWANNTTLPYVMATPKDIKDKFFPYDTKISLSYIADVLRDQFKLPAPAKTIRYTPWGGSALDPKAGYPFKFVNPNYEAPQDLF